MSADTLADVVSAREAVAVALADLRRKCVLAIAAGESVRQVAIAADVSRPTIYRWRKEAASSDLRSL